MNQMGNFQLSKNEELRNENYCIDMITFDAFQMQWEVDLQLSTMKIAFYK